MLANEEIYFKSEQLVISALLIEKNAYLRVESLLRPDMFYNEAHKEIYICIESMTENNEAIDILTISNKLKNNKALANFGGIVYLAQLSGRLISAEHLERHAEIVFNAFIYRRVIVYATQLMQLATQGELCGDELMIEAQTKLNLIDKEIPIFDSILDARSVIEISKNAGLKRIDLYRKGLTCLEIPTGLTQLNKLTGGWQKSELIILAARPSIGKTALAIHFASAAYNAGKHTLIYSLEMSAEKIGDRLILGKSNVNPEHWKFGNCDMYDLQAIDSSCDELSKQSFYIDDTSQLSIPQIKSSAKRMQLHGQCDLIIIDYLQLAEMKSETKMQNRQELVSQASRQAKLLAKGLNIPVILLSQLNRESEGRPGKRPELADLRDSGAIEQDADLVILINRPEHYGIMVDRKGQSTIGRGELIIAKHRNGPTGSVFFKCNPSLTKIEDYKE